MSARCRAMLEDMILNVTFDMDLIGGEAEVYEQLSILSDEDLVEVLRDILANLDS